MTVDKIELANKIAAIAAGSTNPRVASAARAIALAAADPQAQELGTQLWERTLRLATSLQRAIPAGSDSAITAEERAVLEASGLAVAESTRATRAWLYERFFFSTAKAGTLYYDDGRVAFVTDTGTRPIDVTGDDVTAVTANPLTASLAAEFCGQKWVVSFAGPRSGSTLRDAARLPEAYRQLRSWQELLAHTDSVSNTEQ